MTSPSVQEDSVSYEYIVVGSGAGGGPLAANLARAGHSVLLLEAGGDCENFFYKVPCFHGFATEDPGMKWDYFVHHYDDAKRRAADSKYVAKEDGVLYPRAGTLGGCTAHNAMITVLPHASDWNGIADLTGDESWRAEKMHGYFERLEDCQYVKTNAIERFARSVARLFGMKVPRNPGGHGFKGWLTTNAADPKLGLHDPALIDVLLAAAKTALIEGSARLPLMLSRLKSDLDPNDIRNTKDSPEGLCLPPLATSKGHRTGAREFVRKVEKSHADKIVVQLHSFVTRVLFDETNAATGVEYLKGEHLYAADPQSGSPTFERRSVRATREVILCGGAFNSPQLLMLSGIGPRDELARHGIDVRVDLPGVGRNLQDRYEVGVVWQMRFDFLLLKGLTFAPPEEGGAGDSAWVEWLQGRGLYTTNGAVLGVIRRSVSATENPDLFIFGLPGFFKGYFPEYSKQFEKHKNFFTWAILKAHTNNTAGRVTLRSSDPLERPEISFRYFDEGNDTSGADLEAVLDGVKFVRNMQRKVPLAVETELVPGPTRDEDAELREFIRNEAWGHHASCTNRIGRGDDPMAVLDSRFRVRGVKNLRVVDASVFPRIPGFFIVTAVYMISEKASDVILEDARATEPIAVS